MADYYSILNKTISNLGNNTPEIRTAVYGKARSAIEKQLRNMNPTPAEHAVQAQMKLLEDAITLIESENSVTPVTPVTPPQPQPTAPPPVVDDAPTMPEVAPVAATAAVASTVAAAAPAMEPVQPEPVSATPVEPVAAPTAPSAPVMPEPIAPQTEAPVAPVTPVEPQPVTEPQMSANAVEPEPVAPPQQASAELIDTPAPAKKRGILGSLIKWLIVLALIIGGAFAAWSNRDSLKTSIEGMLFGDGNEASSSSTQEPIEKEPVRIGQSGEDTQVTPIEGTSEVEGTTEIVVTETEPKVEPKVDDPVATEPETQQPETTTPSTTETEATPEPTEAAQIGEVAYLYEEGSGGSGATRSAGGVAWELIRQSPGDGLPAEPVIIGNINIAEKDIAAKFTIKRNIDEALSASHLIELQFTLGDKFEGESVENVARFVMKATEEARGEPLVAVPVKVSEGNFLIALNNLQQAVDVNTLLLKDGGWIDVPVTYKSGKRALVTLEKGGTGERVFTEALDDWKNR